VVWALQLCEGEEALRPALAAALQARARAGPAAAAPGAPAAAGNVDELAQLFSQITMQAEQVGRTWLGVMGVTRAPARRSPV
jgi:hypothetical protein